MKWMALGLALLLAGCVGAGDLDGDADAAPRPDDRTSVGHQAVIPSDYHFDGDLLGVGWRTPDGGRAHVGVSTGSHRFEVAPGATELTIDALWQAVGPHLVGIGVYPPSGPVTWYDAGTQKILDQSMSRTIEAPEPGVWSLSFAVQGHAVQLAYEVDVHIDTPFGLGAVGAADAGAPVF